MGIFVLKAMGIEKILIGNLGYKNTEGIYEKIIWRPQKYRIVLFNKKSTIQIVLFLINSIK